MGIYSQYLEQNMSFQQLSDERKRALQAIATLRSRDVLVFPSQPAEER